MAVRADKHGIAGARNAAKGTASKSKGGSQARAAAQKQPGFLAMCSRQLYWRLRLWEKESSRCRWLTAGQADGGALGLQGEGLGSETKLVLYELL